MPLRATHLITSLDADGAQMSLARVLQQLGDHAAEMDVISLAAEGPVGQLLRQTGVRVRSLDMRSFRHAPSAISRLAGWLRCERPSVLVTWLYHANLLGNLAARFARATPVVWNVRHSAFEPRHMKRTTRMVVRLGARLARRAPRRIVFCSQASLAGHCRHGYPQERSLFIPNGFDLQQFRPCTRARAEIRRELRLPPDAPLVGSIGRFHPDKDHANFAAAAGRIFRRCPGAYFVLCGRGIDAENRLLVQLLDRAGVLSRCRLLGPRSDVPRLMAALDIYVSSSITEAFPNVLGEAMACGVPCVATDCGDSRYIVADTGRIVPTRDPDDLADACLALLELPSADRSRLGEAARARIAREFDLRHTAERHFAVWRTAAGLDSEDATAAADAMQRPAARAA